MRLVNLLPINAIKEMENPCWKGYKMVGTKKKGGKDVPNCVPVDEAADSAAIGQPGGFVGDEYDNRDIDEDDDYDELDVEPEEIDDFIKFLKAYKNTLDEGCQCLAEAEYQGREVKLGKPMQGDVKKFKVFVKNPKTGKVIKVNFGQKGMKIRKSNPEARKSFRARMHCDNPGPRTKANYWSCRKW